MGLGDSDADSVMEDNWISVAWPIPNSSSATVGPRQVLVTFSKSILLVLQNVQFTLQFLPSSNNYVPLVLKFHPISLTKRSIFVDSIFNYFQIIRGDEHLEDVACAACPVCVCHYENLKSFHDCTHMVCVTCFEKSDRCPFCNTPRGRYHGKLTNVSNLLIVRKTDIASDFGLSAEVRAASAATGRRPADRTSLEEALERDVEAIRQAELDLAQRDLTDDDDDDATITDRDAMFAPIMDSFQEMIRSRITRNASVAGTSSNAGPSTSNAGTSSNAGPSSSNPRPSTSNAGALRGGRPWRRHRIDSSNEETD